MIAWCSHCSDNVRVEDGDGLFQCCSVCGRVLSENFLTEEPQFMKGADGRSFSTSSSMRSVGLDSSASYYRTLQKGRSEINILMDALMVGGGDRICEQANRFYKLAVDKRFTRGRKTLHVAAACLYMVCRQEEKHFLLIDFSVHLKVSVYVLGAVFLQLCEVLKLGNHPIIQKLVDPSLFIHRFTRALLREENKAVSETALRIVASMKRDWMQTGRKPSGLCGAALYISALSHGFDYSKADVIQVVHVCEATLTKRLIEFENTESGCLTMEEFLSKEKDFDRDAGLICSPKAGEVLCEHKDSSAQHFAHGLCEKCYREFIKISGGLSNGSDPPAFQRAERKRIEAAKKETELSLADKEVEEDAAVDEGILRDDAPGTHDNQDGDASLDGNEVSGVSIKMETAAGTSNLKNSTESSFDKPSDEHDPTETFSDIDDGEMDNYLCKDEEERQYKKLIWEEMNREYLEEQETKEILAKLVAQHGDKPKKERKRKRADESNTTPAETPAEATLNILKQKGFTLKVNLDAVGDLYNMNDHEAKSAEFTGIDADGGVATEPAKDEEKNFWDS